MKCNKCGKKIDTDALVCPFCNAELNSVEEEIEVLDFEPVEEHKETSTISSEEKLVDTLDEEKPKHKKKKKKNKKEEFESVDNDFSSENDKLNEEESKNASEEKKVESESVDNDFSSENDKLNEEESKNVSEEEKVESETVDNDDFSSESNKLNEEESKNISEEEKVESESEDNKNELPFEIDQSNEEKSEETSKEEKMDDSDMIAISVDSYNKTIGNEKDNKDYNSVPEIIENIEEEKEPTISIEPIDNTINLDDIKIQTYIPENENTGSYEPFVESEEIVPLPPKKTLFYRIKELYRSLFVGYEKHSEIKVDDRETRLTLDKIYEESSKYDDSRKIDARDIGTTWLLCFVMGLLSFFVFTTLSLVVDIIAGGHDNIALLTYIIPVFQIGVPIVLIFFGWLIGIIYSYIKRKKIKKNR